MVGNPVGYLVNRCLRDISRKKIMDESCGDVLGQPQRRIWDPVQTRVFDHVRGNITDQLKEDYVNQGIGAR